MACLARAEKAGARDPARQGELSIAARFMALTPRLIATLDHRRGAVRREREADWRADLKAAEQCLTAKARGVRNGAMEGARSARQPAVPTPALARE